MLLTEPEDSDNMARGCGPPVYMLRRCWTFRATDQWREAHLHQ